MFPLFSNIVNGDVPEHKKEIKIASPINGRVKPLDEFPLDLIKSRMLGEGVLVEPSGYQIIAPFEGVVTRLYPTCEELRIKSTQGIIMRIQLGLNGYDLMGEGFKIKVPEKTPFKKGDVLLEFDLNKMKSTLKSHLFAVTILNSTKLKGIKPNYRQVIALEDDIFSLLI